ncbi:MAG: 4-hydroxy-3-methylbut-2-en-1-yl diphosphate synthase [Candidatus Zixiibacteriota bacterium]|nr:MAG: 4-hydroxy-3-methylbut-2-en-1-yl diphosphate synthase [candidate division Zixibacteria bacterium]
MELQYPHQRRHSRTVKIRDVIIGGGFPVAVQTMTTADTRDVQAVVSQARGLFDAGADIVRLAVPDDEAADRLKEIRQQIDQPLVADIHFRHELALKAIEAGFDKIRINPGNIGAGWKVREITRAALDAGLPIRIGVNSGSLPKDLLDKYGHDDPRAFVEAALREIGVLEDAGFNDIVISVKASDTSTAFWAYSLLAERCDYPLHLGITEAGTLKTGSIKSAVGIGALLLCGIGDTIRVSLTADPVHEIEIARQILASCALRRDGVEVISCPTCGRCEIDLIPLAESIEQKTRHIKTHLKVAVMGCVVNGPGEAKAADVGIAGGNGRGVLIKQGEVIKTFPESELERRLLDEIVSMTGEDIDR